MPPARAQKISPQSAFDLMDQMVEAAINFIPMERGIAMMRKWVPRQDNGDLPEDRLLTMVADATLLAANLLLSQPSASGSTAFDRLAKSRPRSTPQEAAAILSLRQARFLLLRFEHAGPASSWIARDVLRGDLLNMAAPELPALEVGTILFGRVASLGEGQFCIAGAITPLDPAAFQLARHHPAALSQTALAASRWTEAVYAHVVRNGTLAIPGVNRPSGDEYEDEEMLVDPSKRQLYDLAAAWLALAGAAPDTDLLIKTRQFADCDNIIDGLGAAVMARDSGEETLALAFERILTVQLDTVRRRESIGTAGLSLKAISDDLADLIKSQGWPKQVRTLFEKLRGNIAGERKEDAPGLERLVQRIQGLRAKTVAHGCTEHEAVAAAQKVAELLDRHGLSLNELEFKAQPCEGIGIQTSRRRSAPIDTCIPAIAAFFDCRVWRERAPDQPFRYIFFGLRGDVAAVQYLYEMVERAFETETDSFRASTLYLHMAGDRRMALNSFLTGLAHGISQKLEQKRAERGAGMRSSSGRDLVPLKESMVDDEMEKLGLTLTTRSVGQRKRVHAGAFEAGRTAGQGFEFLDAITEAA